jgi:cytochrome c oxidase subunit II
MFQGLHFLPEQASTMASKVDALFFFLVGVTVFFSTLIFTLVIVFAVKYRRRSEAERPAAIHGSMILETLWSVIPLAIALTIFAWGATLYFTMSRPPQSSLEIFVVAKQWMWKFQHPGGQREVNELHIPVGRPVKVTMTSEDVIHSFFVPAFRVKMDVVPGKYTTAWFEAVKPGQYHLFCSQYCGTGHSEMGGWVTVMEPAEYEQWLAGGKPGESLVAAGERMFQRLGCQACHLKEGSGRAPSLVGIYGKSVQLGTGQKVVADEGYIRESILNPQAKLVLGYPPIMPTFKGLVSEEQIQQLLAYIKSLRIEEKAQAKP